MKGADADDDLREERITRETGIDARVAAIAEPLLLTMGFRLVRVQTSALNGLTLQIMIERPDGSMSVTECEEVSRILSPLLDVEDPIGRSYHLEISSPGIDRVLVRKSDFVRWRGHLAKIDTLIPVEQRKKFRGRILKVEDGCVVIERDAASYGDEPVVGVPLDAISAARLVLTDDLVRDALKKDKAERAERKNAARLSKRAGNDNGTDDT